MRFKQAASLLLASALTLGTAAPAMASDLTKAGGSVDSKLQLEVVAGGDDPVVFSATVPSVIPVVMNMEGKISVPNNLVIRNNVDSKAIKVTDINVTVDKDWRAVEFQDTSSIADGDKTLAMKLRSDSMKSDGSFTLDTADWEIAASGELGLYVEVQIPIQSSEQPATDIASISFTMDWADGSGGDSTPTNKHTITVTDGEHGKVDNTSSFTTDDSGKINSFPSTTPDSGYIFDHWEDDSGNVVDTNTVLDTDTTIKPVFVVDTKTPSPANWFTTNGTDTITGLSDDYLNIVDAPTVLVIPKAIGGTTIKSIGDNAFKGKDLVTQVVLSDKITTIGDYAFSGCTSIDTIDIPISVTKIGENAFSGCNNLNININIADINHKELPSYIYGCLVANVTSGNRVMLRDIKGNTEQIPKSCIFADSIFQDQNFEFSDVSKCRIEYGGALTYAKPDLEKGITDLYYPTYRDGAKSYKALKDENGSYFGHFEYVLGKGYNGIEDNLNSWRDSSILEQFDGIRIHCDYESIGAVRNGYMLPYDLYVDINYNDRNESRDATGLGQVAMHYLDKTMVAGFDVTGFNRVDARISFKTEIISNIGLKYDKIYEMYDPSYAGLDLRHMWFSMLDYRSSPYAGDMCSFVEADLSSKTLELKYGADDHYTSAGKLVYMYYNPEAKEYSTIYSQSTYRYMGGGTINGVRFK